jgi:hypothetical protein
VLCSRKPDLRRGRLERCPADGEELEAKPPPFILTAQVGIILCSDSQAGEDILSSLVSLRHESLAQLLSDPR